MKKKLIGMIAAIGMMLVTSCSTDETVVVSNNDAQVTFSLGIKSGMNTRAISDGTGINQLSYAIFDSQGNLVTSIENQELNNFPYNTSISLVKGQEYTAVFWAWNQECKAYTMSEDMKSVTVDYKEALNNDETRDAFFKSVTFTLTENTTIDVVLKRPFAQLNVGITEEEWNTAENQGVVIAKSKVEIKQAATTLNLMDGSVEGSEDVTFTANSIPTENLMVDVDCDGNSETYKYISMCYFLANDENGGSSKTTLESLKFTFLSEDGSEIATLEKGLANAPVQRNHRTNVISSPDGNSGIIAGNVTVKVLLDPLYDGEHTATKENEWEQYLGIYTEEALAGKTIEIPTGWHIRNGYIIEPMPEYWTAESTPIYTEAYTIDGKNNTVTFEPYEYKFVAKNAFAAADSKLVTIKDITFAGEHFGIFGGVYGGVSGRNNYNTTLENVQIVNNGIYCYNKDGSVPVAAFSNLGTANLKNCTIIGSYWVEEKDENINAEKSINTYGGAYDMFIPNSATTVINNSTIGNIYIAEHGKLTVSENSKVDKVISNQLVTGQLTIQASTEVTLVNVNQYSDKYPPKVTIEDNATIGTLDLNSINKNNINIAENAKVDKIIWKGTEYTSIADFKTAQ